MNRRTWTVAPLVFASGLCALIYQVVWTRELRFVFGASTAASSAVIAIFIAGLGFGGLWFGRRVERSAKPLEWYGRLELGVAAWTAFTPLLLALIRSLYFASGGSLHLGMVPSTLLRLLLTTLVLGPATFLMGGTLPAVSRAIETDDDPTRRGVALLYGLNTLGAVLGCMLSTFVMLEHLGARMTLYAAVACNVAVALLAIRLGRRPALETEPKLPAAAPMPRPHRTKTRTGKPARKSPSEPPIAPPPPALLVYASAAIVGFAFFLMELVWYRMLGPLLGGTVFTFGLILAVALSGIGLGSGTYALALSSRRNMLVGFALTCALEALLIAMPYALGDRVALWTLELRPVGDATLSGLAFGWSTIALLVVFPGALVSGVQFPLLIALLGEGREQVGRDVGAAYAANTLGAIGGALAGGFGMLPAIGALGCWRLASVLLAIWGAAVASYSIARDRQPRTAAGVIALTALTIGLTFTRGPTAAWRHSPIGAGRVPEAAIESTNNTISFFNSQRRGVDWQIDGIESTVAIDHQDGLSFIVNGKSDGNAREDAATQVMSGLLAAALVPRVEKAMVIGLGTGSTAGWLAKLPEVQQVDVAEIEPAIVEVARRCAAVNQHALENPKLHLHRGDARELLAVSRASYDVIFSEPSNPYRAGIASLYTREFYQAIRKRLTKRGVFVQWMQAYDVDDVTMRTIYATLAAVFPHVETWDGMQNDLLLVASVDPRNYDANALRTRIATEPYASALRVAWNTDSLEGFFAHYVANEAFARAMAEESTAINTDDRSPVEFGFARSLRGDAGTEWALDTARARNMHRPPISGDRIDWIAVAWEREAFSYYTLGRAHPEGLSEADRSRLEALSRWANADFSGALKAWSVADQSPGARPPILLERLMLAELFAQIGDDSSESRIASLAKEQPTLAAALRAVWIARHGSAAAATEVLGRALQAYRSDPWPLRAPMGRVMDELMKPSSATDPALAPAWLDALSKPFAVYVNEATRFEVRVAIAYALGATNAACLDVLTPLEPNPEWSERMLDFRRACYEAHGHPLAQRSAEDLAQFRANEAP